MDPEVLKRERIRHFGRALAGEAESVTEIARFEVDGVPARAAVTVSEGGVLVEGIPESSAPESIESQVEILEDSAETGSNDLSLRISPLVKADAWKARAGDLRTAYLVTFATLGYNYIVQPDLESIRRQIRNPNNAILSGFTVRLGEDAHP